MICRVKGIDIYYEIHGEGRPILMIHGWWPDHRVMKGCMEPIFEKLSGWQRVYFDLPGMGRTKPASWIDSSDRILDLVQALTDRIIGQQAFLLAGQSYGGYLGLGILHRRSEAVLGAMLLYPMIYGNLGKRDLPKPRLFSRDHKLLSRLDAFDRQDFESFSVLLDEANWQRTDAEVMAGLHAADGEFLNLIQQNSYEFSFDVLKIVKPFEKPSLILTGLQDSIVGFRDSWKLLDLMPRATYAILDVAGHNLQIERPELFSALVKDWLERVEKYPESL